MKKCLDDHGDLNEAYFDQQMDTEVIEGYKEPAKVPVEDLIEAGKKKLAI